MFLSSPVDICIYGGAAGGGKTFGLLIEPLRNIGNSRFGAVIFRRTYQQITNEGGMWDESSSVYKKINAKEHKTSLTWRFPSGSKISFRYLDQEKDKYNYDGAQIPFIGFDQLEQFSESQFFYMLSRNRSTCGVIPYVRATCNPKPDCWLSRLIEWYIDQDTGYAIEERAGKIRYFIRINEEIIWSDSRSELIDNYPDIDQSDIKSFSFIPSTVYDNKILLSIDKKYLSNLKALGLVDRERLLGGNWKIKEAAGILCNREWFKIVEHVPEGGIEVRFWDFAATENKLTKGKKKDDPDYTASVRMRKVENDIYILDCTEDRLSPVDIDKKFKSLSMQDAALSKFNKTTYKVRWEIEGGSSGKRVSYSMVQDLAGLDARGIRPQGDKIARFKPLSSYAEHGNVYLLEGSWNEKFLNHLHNQPMDHDDIMDAASGAFNDLNPLGGWSR